MYDLYDTTGLMTVLSLKERIWAVCISEAAVWPEVLGDVFELLCLCVSPVDVGFGYAEEVRADGEETLEGIVFFDRCLKAAVDVLEDVSVMCVGMNWISEGLDG